jgi:hypothetical protein
MTKLPEKPRGNARSTPTRSPMDRVSFEARIAELRRTHDLPETRVGHYRCAVHGRPFTVTFGRLHSADKFRVQTIDKVSSGGGRGPRPKALTWDVREFDYSGWRCAWCNHADATLELTEILCGRCGEQVCGGRSSPGYFRCTQACGTEGGDLQKRTFLNGGKAQPSAPRTQSTAPRLAPNGGNGVPRLPSPTPPRIRKP